MANPSANDGDAYLWPRSSGTYGIIGAIVRNGHHPEVCKTEPGGGPEGSWSCLGSGTQQTRVERIISEVLGFSSLGFLTGC